MTHDLPPHVSALFEATAYPHECGKIDMIQTHISWVFLAGEFAYKIKKPVDFGFLDFSSLEKRKHFCEVELQLNRRLSPEIYLDVLPISQHDAKTRIGENSRVVDYCLKLKRFEQNDLFDLRLKHDQFDSAWMDNLASDIANFHIAQESVYADRLNHARLLDDHIRANLNIAARHPGSALNAVLLGQLNDFATRTTDALNAQLCLRQQQGFVRHCHGDLHFRNIVLIDGKPHPFDCIEFNDDFAIIDQLNDVAFLLMDCDSHKRPDLGFRFLSRYLEQSGDYAGLALMDYYCFYRATVRGKVACLLAEELDGTEQERQFIEAIHYFRLAESYCRHTAPRLFAVGGLSGSGKSHLARIGCGLERAIVIRSDATRKRIAGDYPELALYGRQMHTHTYKAMFVAARNALKAGYSVILDATFLHPGSRNQVKVLADEMVVPMHFFWLDIAEPVLRSRVRQRQQANNDISDADLNVLDLQLQEYSKPTEPWVNMLDCSDHWPDLKQ